MEELNYRSIFANDVCQLILIKHNCSLLSALEDLKIMREHFEDHVRNIYELDREIPLFNWLHHLNCTYDDLGYESQEEYDEKMYDIFDSMCKRFGDKMLLANFDIPLCKKMYYNGYNNNQIEKLFNKDNDN